LAGFSGVWCAVLVVGAELPSEGAAHVVWVVAGGGVGCLVRLGLSVA